MRPKVLGISGSPRKKNSFTLLEATLSTAKEAGKGRIETKMVRLGDVDLKPCNGCSEYCEAVAKCQIKDGMQNLYSKLKEADAIIIATSTYFWNVTGLTKNFQSI